MMTVILATGFVVLCFCVCRLTDSTRREYDCDICGQHKACVVWKSSKVSVDHICDQCRASAGFF